MPPKKKQKKLTALDANKFLLKLVNKKVPFCEDDPAIKNEAGMIRVADQLFIEEMISLCTLPLDKYPIYKRLSVGVCSRPSELALSLKTTVLILTADIEQQCAMLQNDFKNNSYVLRPSSNPKNDYTNLGSPFDNYLGEQVVIIPNCNNKVPYRVLNTLVERYAILRLMTGGSCLSLYVCPRLIYLIASTPLEQWYSDAYDPAMVRDKLSWRIHSTIDLTEKYT